MRTDTIIVLLGATGHRYVAKVGRDVTITPRLDKAYAMSRERADQVISELHECRAVLRDLDDYKMEVAGRQQQVSQLLRQLPVEA